MTTIPMPSTQSIVQLDWTMKDGILVVTPRDQDRFVIKVGRAIEFLQQVSKGEIFRSQFNVLLKMLGEWIKTNSNHIERAFVTQRDGALAFVLVRSDCVYDDEFEDALSDIDYRIANDPDLDLIKMNAIALPPASEEAVYSFIDQDFGLEYIHGQTRRSSCPGK